MSGEQLKEQGARPVPTQTLLTAYRSPLTILLLYRLARLVRGRRGAVFVVACAYDFGADVEMSVARGVAARGAQGVCVDAV